MVKHTQTVTQSHANAAHAAVIAAANGTDGSTAPTPKAKGKDILPSHEPEAKQNDSAKRNTNIAANKLTNDAFSVYDDVNVDELQDDAIKALHQSEKLTRKEGQMQIANILARYHQGKLEGENLSPEKLYIPDENDKTMFKLNVTCVKNIAKVVYNQQDVEKMDRAYEARIRKIAPIVYYAIENRIPLVWDAKQGCLMVPEWLVIASKGTAEKAKSRLAEVQSLYGDVIGLDGKEKRTVETVLANLPDLPIVKRPRAAKTPEAGTQAPTLEKVVADEGLLNTLDAVVKLLCNQPNNEKLAGNVLEQIVSIYDHAVAKNGQAELDKAAAAVRGKKSA